MLLSKADVSAPFLTRSLSVRSYAADHQRVYAIPLAIDNSPVDTRAELSATFQFWNWHRSTRSEEHTSELQSLMRISYAVFCLKKKKIQNNPTIQQRISVIY